MPPNKSKFHFDQGLNFFQRGDYQKASTYFQEAVMEDPQFHEALYNLSCCLSMTGDKDNALVYLARSVKLNMHTMDWAKEDREFDKLRDDPIFQRIISGETNKTVKQEEEIEELEDADFDPDAFEETVFEKISAGSGQTSSGEPPPNFSNPGEKLENLPPCQKCGGLLHSEKRTRHDPKFLIALLAVGFIGMFGMYFTTLGLLGVPLIAIALYFFTQVQKIWVCNSCGAAGLDCGQPPETMEIRQAENTDQLNSQTH